MSQAISRYSRHYQNLLRTDVANYYPKNVFVREPNVKAVYPDIPYSVTQ
jgi:hypothetical protein